MTYDPKKRANAFNLIDEASAALAEARDEIDQAITAERSYDPVLNEAEAREALERIKRISCASVQIRESLEKRFGVTRI
ncbi:MAG: hypothetical protein EA339_13410 [Rhodobacteraceae bacterium]|nr:MAG: hypothetical protein EA339_13410 [Paracoccaceae bacterium]